MTHKDFPRLLVTGGVFALFAYVLWHNVSNEMLIGAMIGALTTTVTFWLGSSKGSSDKSLQIEEMQVRPQRVTVDQPADSPIPVEEHRP